MPNRFPSILLADVDDAVEHHLIGKVNDLWAPPVDPEEAEDLTEALRSDLHEAIAKVLAQHGVSVVGVLRSTSAPA